MALVRIALPDLVGGTTRQPDTLRFQNQVQEADNVFLHFSVGAEKRRGSQYVKNLTDPTGNLHIHWHERSASQRYLFIFKQDGTTPLYIYKVDGTPCTITYDAGVAADLKSYLNTAPTNIRAVSFDDTTIVANTNVTVATDSATQTYNFGGTPVQNNGNANNRDSWDEFDLPPAATNVYYYARQDASGQPRGWYKSISTSAQPWYERVRTPMAHSQFTFNTMPIRIVQTGDTTFEVKQCVWKPRLSGDGATNPPASFVGKKINDIALHRNRLWIAAGENVVGSQAGDYFNFWLNSFGNIVDSDPIDVQLGSAQVSKINFIQPYNKALVIFTNGGQQFELRAREALTPTTVAIVASTAYTSPEGARPIIVGSGLYWVANKGAYSQMYEYISDDAAAQSTAMDVTAHIDAYISKDIKWMTASGSGDMLIVGDGTTNTMWACFMYWQGERKLQNSWCKWIPADDGFVLSARMFGDEVYSLHRSDGFLRINKMQTRFIDNFPSYLPRLDSARQETGIWTKGLGTTQWVVDWNSNIDAIFCGSEWSGTKEGVWLIPDDVIDNGNGTCNVIANGDWSAFPVWIGCNYNMNIELSRQYVRDANQVPRIGNLQLRNCSVYHRNTGYFQFVVDPDVTPSATRYLTYTGKTIGSSFLASINSISDNEVETFKVMSSASAVDVSIQSNHPAPCNITAIEFNSNFVEMKTSPADR